MSDKLKEQLKLLCRLDKEVDDIYSNIAAHFGMPDTEFWILYAVSHSQGEVTQKDLQKEFLFPVQTINSAIGKLIKKDLVELRVIPKTKNRKEILLTEKGAKFVKNTIDKVDEIECNALSLFDENERKQFLSFLCRHVENLKREKERAFGCSPA
ncbi:MAG: MarR family transcriptional regulator [Ruminococcus sp.]|nr:MarR family transcriptional regulator [Ruminococcus sp.]MDY3894731.1 MarR family winged helix-turn-helix transcriptional regulator [Candidatus Fimenecus sp.]